MSVALIAKTLLANNEGSLQKAFEEACHRLLVAAHGASSGYLRLPPMVEPRPMDPPPTRVLDLDQTQHPGE